MYAYLENGEYRYDGAGGVMLPADESDALLRRCLDRLKARRGGFVLDPTFGSRMWTLGREDRRSRQSAALRYAAEALEPEGVEVRGVEISDGPDGVMDVAVTVAYGESAAVVTVRI